MQLSSGIKKAGYRPVALFAVVILLSVMAPGVNAYASEDNVPDDNLNIVQGQEVINNNANAGSGGNEEAVSGGNTGQAGDPDPKNEEGVVNGTENGNENPDGDALPAGDPDPKNEEGVVNGTENGNENPDGDALPAGNPDQLNGESTIENGNEGELIQGTPRMMLRSFSAPGNSQPGQQDQLLGQQGFQLRQQDQQAGQQYNTNYNYNAKLADEDDTHKTPDGEDRPGGALPGVYTVDDLHTNTNKKEDFSDADTIGMPSIADQNLPDAPTNESPAIIQGAAVGYEKRISPVEYETIDPANPRPMPYEDYKVVITEQQGPDGTMQKKPTGFDQTYVIVRLDVSEIMEYKGNSATSANADEDKSTSGATKYLHVKQEGNNALIPGAGVESKNADEQAKGGNQFTTQTGERTGAYSIDYLIKKATDKITGIVKPYVDVLLFATSSVVAGADAGKENVPDGDIKLQMYVDETLDYNPSLEYDPLSTDVNHATNCLAKFFDATKVAAEKISRYLVKGKDLKLEVAVENSYGEKKDTGTSFWSLNKAFEKPYYDLEADASADDPGCGRDIKLISEVAITDSLGLEGTSETQLKKRTLDVNSYDVQIANNTSGEGGGYSDGFTITNAWLKIKDSSATTGAEMAIGNNARFVIDKGGKLIIDETCQLEIEWDGASTTNPDGSPAQNPDTLNNGVLDLRAGGTIENNGIISIEGFEGKPHAQGGAVIPVAGCGEMTINEGSTLVNNGCMVVNGRFYNLGTLENNGRYDDVISSNDPDKGRFDYHKGIQIAWKDDVTQEGVVPGELNNGKKGDKIVRTATLNNNGDIVLTPGTINNYGIINTEKGNIYLAAATEAIIPIEPDPNNPTVVTKRITLNPPKGSVVNNFDGGVINGIQNIKRALVALNDNIGFGAMTVYNVVTPTGSDPQIWRVNDYNDLLPRPNTDETDDDSSTDSAEQQPASDLLLALSDVKFLIDDTLVNGNMSILLYSDGTFTISDSGREVIKGRFAVVDDELVFILPDGTVVKSVIDSNGNYVFTVKFSDGSVITFKLTKDEVLRIKAALTQRA